MTQIVPQPENLTKLVFFVRGEKVLLDADLAMLYGVETGALNRAVKRNIERFPAATDSTRMGRLEMPNWHLKFTGHRNPG